MALLLQPRTARELAYRVLEDHRTSETWVQELLHRAFASGSWSRPDRGLITELVNGIVRRRETLNAMLNAVMSRPLAQVEPSLVTLLQLGAYQLVFLERVPAFAAVHETVELTKALGQRRWTGIANGVMRGLSRLLAETTTDAPAENAIPIANGRFRTANTALFPSPLTDPVQYVARAFSLPEWLVARWHARWSFADLLQIAFAVNASPTLFVRVDVSRVSLESLIAHLQAAGVEAVRCGNLPVLRLENAGPIDELPGYPEGWWVPQDLTAARAAMLLGPPAGARVWDVCAAPGTKTTQLAELVGPDGHVLATDVEAGRLERVRENVARLGLNNVHCELISAEGRDGPAGPFDAILLDAPCSNTGVLHRRPEARWRIQPYDLGELSSLQRRLLHSAMDRLRRGGRLVYSTCSIEPEENEQVVQRILEQRQGIKLLQQTSYLPGSNGDGGFQALLQSE